MRLPQGRPWIAPLAALVALVAFTIVYELVTKSRSDFASGENLFNILRQWSFVGIIAVGMTLIISLGGIDLSVGSLAALAGGTGIMTLNALIDAGAGEMTATMGAMVVILLVSLVAGALNGALVAWGRLAPFIATLGGLAAYRSLALALADGGEFRSASADVFGIIGQGGIPIPWTNVAPRAPVPVPLLLPWPVLIFVVVAVAGHVVLTRTVYGRHLLAIGGNERAAEYSAINVAAVRFRTYLIAGALTGLAGCLLASRMNSVSSAQTGLLFELDVIAAVVIGGTRMRGGAGTIFGTVVGVLILGVIGNMLNLLQVSVYLQGLVKGLIIVLAVLAQRRHGNS